MSADIQFENSSDIRKESLRDRGWFPARDTLRQAVYHSGIRQDLIDPVVRRLLRIERTERHLSTHFTDQAAAERLLEYRNSAIEFLAPHISNPRELLNMSSRILSGEKT